MKRWTEYDEAIYDALLEIDELWNATKCVKERGADLTDEELAQQVEGVRSSLVVVAELSALAADEFFTGQYSSRFEGIGKQAERMCECDQRESERQARRT